MVILLHYSYYYTGAMAVCVVVLWCWDIVVLSYCGVVVHIVVLLWYCRVLVLWYRHVEQWAQGIAELKSTADGARDGVGGPYGARRFCVLCLAARASCLACRMLCPLSVVRWVRLR